MEKEFYPVFSVDKCFCSYAMDYVLIGAKHKNDLLAHLKQIIDEDPKRIAKDDYRIQKVQNLFTDKPYEILDSYGYYE